MYCPLFSCFGGQRLASTDLCGRVVDHLSDFRLAESAIGRLHSNFKFAEPPSPYIYLKIHAGGEDKLQHAFELSTAYLC